MGRPHGYVRYKVEGCRCEVCTEGNRTCYNRRTRLIAYEQWRPYVDAEPARAHVRAHMEKGIGWIMFARLCDVPRGTVSVLLYGRSGRAPSRTVRSTTAAALLALEVEQVDVVDLLDPGVCMLHCVGAARRLQALVALGWSLRHLARELGVSKSSIERWAHGRPITAEYFIAVRDLYDRLWAATPPQRTTQEAAVVARVREYAAQHGWVSALAWDDTDLDNPAARPQGVLRRAAS
ncbi:hypothetical protein [Nocardiopsis sp. NPDC057823]|uniref:hypothetical protein n=1 Tax=Nocardiopsis sp. NPDC057823 TaxID=3346256 RepID=UPI00366B4400